MSQTKRIAKNVVANWTAMGVSMAFAFVLSPFIVHRLGNVAYGVWVLVSSATTYLGLLDLGLRGAIVRFVSRARALALDQEASDIVSAAVWLRLWISVLVLFVGFVFSFALCHVFHIPSELQTAARHTVLVSAVSMAVTLFSGVFIGILSALQRYDLQSGIAIIQAVLRSVGVIYLLNRGNGILALAALELVAVVVATLLLMAMCFRIYPGLRISLKKPPATVIQKLWKYSSYIIVTSLAGQLVYYSDNVVVGAVLSPAVVTLYAIGGSLLMYARQIVAAMSGTFSPIASTFDAEGRLDQQRRLLIQGTRATLIVSLPVVAVLFFRGPSFIGLWMGNEYAQVSGMVLRILLLAQVFAFANSTSGGIVRGIEKHQLEARWSIVEGVANLGLSILLVRQLGVYGVAWGTVIPSLAIHLLFWPKYICKLLDISLKTYLWQAWIKAGIAVAPFAFVCYLMDRCWPARSLAYFFSQVAATLPIFAAMLFLVFRTEVPFFVDSRTERGGNLLSRSKTISEGT
jgi:O-antigen/teichoic acid export membrane protein